MKNTKLASQREGAIDRAIAAHFFRGSNGLPRMGYLYLFVTILALFTVNAFGAAGDLDLTFGRSGAVTTDFNGRNDIANAAALQADGRMSRRNSFRRYLCLDR